MFLNKYDLLEKKLGSGVKVKKYMPSFGDRENSAPVVAKCKLHSHTYIDVDVPLTVDTTLRTYS